MEKISKFVVCLGAAAILIASAPGAQGCAHAVLPSLLSPESTEARAAGTDPSVEPGAPAAGYQAIVGLWLSTALVGGQPIGQGFESFTSDGLEVLIENSPTLEGNVCLGVWAPTGKNSLKINHPAWDYDSSGALTGTVILKSQITIDPGGNTYKGTFTYVAYDLNGNVVPGSSFSGTLTGKRITAN